MITAAGAAVVVLGASAPGLAAGTPDPADDKLPSAVETFEYPGAAKILKEQGLTLESGDGHILLTSCMPLNNDVRDDIVVYTKKANSAGRNHFCFKVTGNGKKGYLALNVPDVIGVDAGKYPVSASAGGPNGPVHVPKNTFKAMGEASWDHPATLLALQVG
ncbi:hypothetical protein BLA24_22315 [Streptomyces cinnamoneus]|uniref:Secreted protein n=1 Tax=Streptomyces cinnamoneus TaxID=53446 RepID=A0A2G1XGC1_STRCJ|nr:hypothetical protein BLA24_22315 [Streptomyces cinnamoneus]PPT12924.1 hypothetical protein CYQ11_08470 [Streptomyces cinnamoneus]